MGYEPSEQLICAGNWANRMMTNESIITNRKKDHIQINLDMDVLSAVSTGLDQYYFIHEALPNLNLGDISIEQILFKKKMRAPVLISSMTGGTDGSARLNQNLATVAQEFGFAMGVGSQRAGLEDPSTRKTFQIRKIAPDILILANLGAIQLNNGYSIDECKKAVEMVDADGLILHLNPLQEALQQEGNTNFQGLLKQIGLVCKFLQVPVVIKEVGWGISGKTARQLYDVGVSAIDVAGAGGTSWSQVEMYRESDPGRAEVAAAFRNWGIPTAESIILVKEENPDGMIFASGGLKDGIDILKTIALGTRLGGIARPFLKTAAENLKAAQDYAKTLTQQIKIAMFVIGAGSLVDVAKCKIVRRV